MADTAAAKRYARALYALAGEQERLEPVREDLANLHRLLGECDEFAAFVRNPLIPGEKRAAIFRELAGDRADPLTLRFLAFLDSKDRLDALSPICSLFSRLYQDEHEILQLEIISAFPLDEGQLLRICERFGEKFGKTIHHTTSIDPTLIGGFRVRVGDTIYDSSIHTKLETLRRQLLHA